MNARSEKGLIDEDALRRELQEQFNTHPIPHREDLTEEPPAEPKRVEANSVLDPALLAHLQTNIKQPRDADAFTRLASVFLIGVWVTLNTLNGVDLQVAGQLIKLQLDANFLATLSYLAITAAGVLLGTAVGGRPNKT